MEDNVAQEFKDNKNYMTSYFNEEKLSELMKYVLFDHDNITEKKVAFKFPNIATEILSSTNNKIYEFFGKQDPTGGLPNFERLFTCLHDENGEVNTEELNFTRAGYLHKIISNLLNAKAQTYADHIFRKPLLFKCLLKHSYSKSISNLLLSLLALPQNSENTSNINVTDVSPNASHPNPNWLKEVLAIRISIFEEIVQEAIASAEKREHIDLNTHLSFLVIGILSKDFSDKEKFVEVFMKNYLDEIVNNFVGNYSSIFNNRLGNMFLIALDILLKENENKKYVEPKKINEFYNMYLELLKGEIRARTNRRSVSTFSKEIPKTNIKIYKVLESVFILNKHYLSTKQEDMIIGSGLEKILFWFYETYPYNNVLHNQVQKILNHIVTSNNPKMIELYFTKNEEFFAFIDSTYELIEKARKNCKEKVAYFGQVKVLANAIIEFERKSEGSLTDSRWIKFINNYLNEENEKENHALGDVDPNAVESDDFEFFFSLEDVKKKYADYLSLGPQDFEQTNDEDEGTVEDAEMEHEIDEEERDEGEDTSIEKDKLIDEIKTLNINSTETNSFTDSQFWKSSIDYDVDDLLHDL